MFAIFASFEVDRYEFIGIFDNAEGVVDLLNNRKYPCEPDLTVAELVQNMSASRGDYYAETIEMNKLNDYGG